MTNCILLVGPVGSGKTSIGAMLIEMASRAGRSCVYEDQDYNGGNVKRLESAVKEAIDKDVFLLVHGKMNHTAKTREQSIKMFGGQPFIVVNLAEDLDWNVLGERVSSRGPHPTLQGDYKRVIGFIRNSYEAPKEDEFLGYENFCGYYSLSMNMPLIEKAQFIGKIFDIDDDGPFKLRFCNYYGLRINPSQLDKVNHALLPVKISFKPSHHVTLVHHSDFSTRMDIVYECIERLGEEVPLRITSLSYNDRVAAFTVAMDFPCANVHPHITAGTARGVNPKESNVMLSEDHAEIEYVTSLKGTVEMFT